MRSFLVTISIIKIEKSIDGVLGIRTRGRRMLGADENTEPWRSPAHGISLVETFSNFERLFLRNLFQDIADLMSIVPSDSEEPSITGGAFDDVKDTVSPFGYNRCEGVDLGAGDPDWIVGY